MHIQISPNQLVLIARMPMPPSVNHANRAQVRERKNYTAADYLAGKKQYYPTVRKDAKAAAYREEALWRLRCPEPPQWQSWQEPMTVRALREDLRISLDFELWEFFRSDESDIDNRVKELQDILAIHLDIDDKRIVNGKQRKRVHPSFDPHIVAILRITEAIDTLAEHNDLNDFLSQYMEERTYASTTEMRAFASAPTTNTRGIAT